MHSEDTADKVQDTEKRRPFYFLKMHGFLCSEMVETNTDYHQSQTRTFLEDTMKAIGAPWLSLPLPESLTIFINRSASQKASCQEGKGK